MTQHWNIFASSKPWHRQIFDEGQYFPDKKIEWVNNPESLVRTLQGRGLPNYIFFFHWNWLVPEEVWSNVTSVCFHMTDVPYGRGGSPLQNLIVRGFKETQLTALKMVEELDAGPYFLKETLSLVGSAKEIYERAAVLSLDMAKVIMDSHPEPKPQTGPATIFKRRAPAESELPHFDDLSKLYDFIRMLDAPTYPRAFLKTNGLKFVFSDARWQNNSIKAEVLINIDQGDE